MELAPEISESTRIVNMKQNQKYYWKVVRKHSDGTLTSTSIRINPFYVRYKIGEVTRPSVGRLFVFKCRSYARRFKRSLGYSGVRILKVKVDGIQKYAARISYLSNKSSINDLKQFWDGLERGKCLGFAPAPDGTVLVDSVTPVGIE